MTKKNKKAIKSYPIIKLNIKPVTKKELAVFGSLLQSEYA